jgi:hypothetical protein
VQVDPPITFRGALQLLGRHDQPVFDALNRLLGGALSATPMYAADALFSWIDEKGEATRALRALLDKGKDRLLRTNGSERQQLITAVHTVVVMSALLNTLTILQERLQHPSPHALEWLYGAQIPAPSAVQGFHERLPAIVDVGELALANLGLVTHKMFVSRFLRQYEAGYRRLVADVPEFGIWAVLGEPDAPPESFRNRHAGLGQALVEQAAAMRRLERLMECLVGEPEAEVPEAAAVLHATNAAALDATILPLFALLCHQPLLGRRQVLDFATGVVENLPDSRWPLIAGLLQRLAATVRDRYGTDRLRDYRPQRTDRVREIAAYSVNLVTLRVYLDSEDAEVPITAFAPEQVDPLAWWRSTVTIWRAGLDEAGYSTVLLGLDVTDRTVHPADRQFGYEWPVTAAEAFVGRRNSRWVVGEWPASSYAQLMVQPAQELDCPGAQVGQGACRAGRPVERRRRHRSGASTRSLSMMLRLPVSNSCVLRAPEARWSASFRIRATRSIVGSAERSGPASASSALSASNSARVSAPVLRRSFRAFSRDQGVLAASAGPPRRRGSRALLRRGPLVPARRRRTSCTIPMIPTTRPIGMNTAAVMDAPSFASAGIDGWVSTLTNRAAPPPAKPAVHRNCPAPGAKKTPLLTMIARIHMIAPAKISQNRYPVPSGQGREIAYEPPEAQLPMSSTPLIPMPSSTRPTRPTIRLTTSRTTVFIRSPAGFRS